MSESKRYGHLCAAMGGTSDDSTFNQGLRRQLYLQLLGVNGVTNVQLSNYRVCVVFHSGIVSTKEIDAIVTDLITKAALNSTLFPDVAQDGKVKRHSATGKLNLGKAPFEVIMSSLSDRPEKPSKPVLGKTTRVFDLNALIVGLNPEDGSTQTTVMAEFHKLFGAKISAVPGLYDFNTWKAQVQVTFYADMISIDELDEAVKKVLTEIYNDPDYGNMFPHLRGTNTSVEAVKVWTSND